jgi:hypothetical protein
MRFLRQPAAFACHESSNAIAPGMCGWRCAPRARNERATARTTMQVRIGPCSAPAVRKSLLERLPRIWLRSIRGYCRASLLEERRLRVESGSQTKTSRTRGSCAVGGGIVGSPGSGRFFAFAGRSCIASAAAAQALAKSLTLFGIHLLPALEFPTPPLAAIATVSAKAAK